MKWVIFALLILISCAPAAQEITTKPVVETKPIAQPPTAPLEPQVKAPQEVQAVKATLAPTQPPTSLSPEEDCVELCETNCAATAQNACTQHERSTCKAHCTDNPTIDPSACTQTCAYIAQPNVCKQQMEQFCSAQCVSYCH